MNYSKNKTQKNWIKDGKLFGKNLWSLDTILALNWIEQNQFHYFELKISNQFCSNSFKFYQEFSWKWSNWKSMKQIVKISIHQIH